ncbi:uncharacterized protein LOC130531222 isoform X5 [Takifugu flavidus]|uniref:uncharacterized protein LOC130531222 isoform X5 n=1 Tax=Takifugu flavidus TaxID=433684 RepID=UPI002544AEF8|nr:uncharacterized protein LOC130531222 isoform X5 [Takifugu flavidus]
MLILFYILLFPVRFGGCTNNNIETKNVTVGETVRLKCPRKTLETLLWIRVIPGFLPERLGKSSHHTKDSHFTTKIESGSFDLVINNTRVDDTGVYFCMTGKSAFLKRVDLTVVGDGVPTAHPYDPTPGERSVLLQCPVLSDSENPTSLDDLNSRCCGSRSVGPFFSFHCRNNVEVDENNLNRSRNSVFSNICSSGDLCCSVGKCEQTCGNCSEPEIEVKIKDGHISSTVLYTLGAAVSVGLIVLFIYLRTEQKKNLCGCCTARFTLQRTAVKVSVDPCNQQTSEEQDLVYAIPNIARRKSVRNDDTEKEERSIYSDVREYSGGAD